MLAHIWNLADIQKRGKLNSDEFAVAMHLIYQKLNGVDLPSTLPQNLIPPSQKELSALSDLAKLDALQQQPIRRISPSSSL
ncbi:actin organization and endocytosis protein, partial [Kappamyces sp. JEL0680]